MKHVTSVRAVAFSPDGTRLATSNDRMARLWEVATGREQAQLEHDDGVSAVAFSPDGTRLATVSPSQDGPAVGGGHRPGTGPAGTLRRGG